MTCQPNCVSTGPAARRRRRSSAASTKSGRAPARGARRGRHGARRRRRARRRWRPRSDRSSARRRARRSRRRRRARRATSCGLGLGGDQDVAHAQHAEVAPATPRSALELGAVGRGDPADAGRAGLEVDEQLAARRRAGRARVVVGERVEDRWRSASVIASPLAARNSLAWRRSTSIGEHAAGRVALDGAGRRVGRRRRSTVRRRRHAASTRSWTRASRRRRRRSPRRRRRRRRRSPTARGDARRHRRPRRAASDDRRTADGAITAPKLPVDRVAGDRSRRDRARAGSRRGTPAGSRSRAGSARRAGERPPCSSRRGDSRRSRVVWLSLSSIGAEAGLVRTTIAMSVRPRRWHSARR